MDRGLRLARAGVGLLALLVIACSVEVVFHVLPESATSDFQKVLSNGIFAGATALCVLRGLWYRRERAAWLLLAAALGAWLAGNLVYTALYWDAAEAPFPSWADLGYLAFYPLALAGLSQLLKCYLGRPTGAMWIDGALGALAVAAVGAAIVFDAVQETTGGSAAVVATNLAYPLGDLLLVGLAVATIGMGGWHLWRPMAPILSGLLVFAVVDSLYLFETAAGTYVDGEFYDPGWEWAAVLISAAAWRPVGGRRQSDTPDAERRSIAVPLTFGLVALGMLVYDHFEQVDNLALVLATGSILAVLARLALTFRQNMRMLTRSQREANQDALTGLRNRRRLLRDLEHAPWKASGLRHALVFADLDG